MMNEKWTDKCDADIVDNCCAGGNACSPDYYKKYTGEYDKDTYAEKCCGKFNPCTPMKCQKSSFSNLKIDNDESRVAEDMSWIQSIDGYVWTKKFMETFQNVYPGYKIDGELIHGWMCNSIMAGFDEASRRKDREEQWVYILSANSGGVIGVYKDIPDKDTCDTDYSRWLGHDLIRNEHGMPVSGQDSRWNCSLVKWKVDSENKITEPVNIEYKF